MYIIDELTGSRLPAVQYGYGEESPVYYRVCEKCGMFVKADEKYTTPEYIETNAICAQCGRTKMVFCCWADEILLGK